ncbi:hypothetical protein PHLCEN_2v12761 [Hermanssonia centrifuga]|uniref:Uncharacterized protein n=1 Tax=Hermanssonia centrifuga TaxID=98765 RepID=A0A2R6NG74_9APHY|nr:hypothetical protein PHLCEN_2v12761 [Hermanssonia centrifuga]
MEHTTRSKPGLITKALRYPMCTQSVLEAMLRIPACAQLECSASGATELPRRLFRSLSSQEKKLWNTEDAPLPLLRYLYAHPRIPTPHADSWDGYPLTRAVASGFIPLVHFLLDKEASPAHKGAIAVHVAIRRRDLRLVKMLIEPDVSPAPVREGELKHDTHKGGKVSIRKRRKSVEEDYGAKKGAKRRRIEDRVSVNAAMLKAAVACDARDIAEYFMKEKSCIPDMETVKLLSAQQSGSERKKTNRHNPGSHHYPVT